MSGHLFQRSFGRERCGMTIYRSASGREYQKLRSWTAGAERLLLFLAMKIDRRRCSLGLLGSRREA
jgi:hypothetical protein